MGVLALIACVTMWVELMVRMRVISVGGVVLVCGFHRNGGLGRRDKGERMRVWVERGQRRWGSRTEGSGSGFGVEEEGGSGLGSSIEEERRSREGGERILKGRGVWRSHAQRT